MDPPQDIPRLLDVIDITEPCQVSWESMAGDERTRFCGMCKKNVYNISDMTSTEAETFLQENLGTACLKFYRREDGTIATDSCPRIFRGVRNVFRFIKQAVAVAASTVMSTSAGFAHEAKSAQQFNAQSSGGPSADPFNGCRNRMGYVPNIYRMGSPRTPPVSARPTDLITNLILGDYALGLESEIYVQDGKTFINENPRETEKPETFYRKRVGACIDGCTAAGAFQRGKQWAVRHNDRIAESYFKLALKLTILRKEETEILTEEIVRQYGDLLRRSGRADEAARLMQSEIVNARKNRRERMKKLLGIDPEMLSRRSAIRPDQKR